MRSSEEQKKNTARTNPHKQDNWKRFSLLPNMTIESGMFFVRLHETNRDRETERGKGGREEKRSRTHKIIASD